MRIPRRIVSGGQTGVDRAALDWAIRARILHGGWCPNGRIAEDGLIPPKYKLKPTPSPDYNERTELNVRDSDATVIFSEHLVLSGGSAATAVFCAKWKKPCLHLVAEALTASEAGVRLQQFVNRKRVRILNVAGPRVTTERNAGAYAADTLQQAFGSRARHVV